MASVADDQARLLVSIEATMAKFQKQMAVIAKDAAGTAKTIEDNFKRANDNAGRSAEAGGRKASAAFNQQRATAQNLSFQLNDIATQLASGASPFTIMAQQGGQVAQALNSTGGARGAVTALGAAFAGLANPIGIASVALIGIVGYATQYLMAVISTGEDANKTIKEQAELIQKVADRWGGAVPAIKAYADELKRAQEVAELKGATKALVGGEIAKANVEIRELTAGLAELREKLQEAGNSTEEIASINRAFKALEADVTAGRDSAKSLAEVQRSLADAYRSSSIPAAKEYADQFGEIAKRISEATDRMKDFREQERLALEQWAVGEINRVAPGNLGQLSPIYSNGGRFQNPQQAQDARAAATKSQFQIEQEKLAASTKKVRDSFDALSDGVVKRYVDQVVKAESGGDRFAKNPMSSATGLGQFIESTWLTMFRKEFPDRAASMSRETILALRTDADVSRQLIEAYARENADLLRQAGVAVNEAALHLAHFLGPGGAASVLKAAPGTPVSRVLSPAQIKANPTILGGDKTVDDVIAYGANRAVDTKQIALDYQNAEKSAKAFDKVQQQAAQSADQLGQAVGQALNSLVSALSDGKLEAQELLGIALQLIQAFSRMPGGAGGGGFLGGLLSAFGGFFATGGRLPAGKWGIAGERGPEIIRGPATISPIATPRAPAVHRMAAAGSPSIYMPVSISAPGADAAALNRVMAELKTLRSAVPSMSVSAMQEQQIRGGRR